MFLRDRLTDPLCPGVALRPQLKAAKDKLYTLLSNAVEKQGANSSYLLIGARGTGKTLVSPGAAHCLIAAAIMQNMPKYIIRWARRERVRVGA